MTDADAPRDRLGRAAASLADLARSGVLDAELAGLLWVLVEGGMSVVVTGSSGLDRAALRDALLDLAPTDGDPVRMGSDGTGEVEATDTVDRDGDRQPLLITPDLIATADDGPALDPEATRRVVRATTQGSTLAATIPGDSLAAVLDALGAAPIGLEPDELSYLGLVLVLGPDANGPASGGRITAAHWIRPVARDAHGHLQRLGPAVLATWDPALGRWEHFAWAIMPELAMRLGRPIADVSRDAADRAAIVADVAARESRGPGRRPGIV